MTTRKWTRKCNNFKQAVTNTAIKLGIPEDVIETTILKYLYKCKQLIMQGERIQLPGVIYIGTYHMQLKKLRKFLNYKGMKKRYGKKEYFLKHIKK